MRYFVPRLVLGLRCDAQTEFVDKFGGLPWGVPAEAWPTCAQCRRPQSHVGQLQHDDERLDLGGAKRVLVLFQCEWGPYPCLTFDPKDGANAALVLSSVEDGLTQPPDPSPPMIPELRVAEWRADDDGIDPSRYDEFFSNDRWYELQEDGSWDAITLDTKVGGPPHWLQWTEDGPPPPWRFVLQLPEGQAGDGPEPTAQETGWGLQRTVGPGEVRVEYPDGMGRGDTRVRIATASPRWWVLGPNFGMGMAYVFVNTATEPPAARMFWQR